MARRTPRIPARLYAFRALLAAGDEQAHEAYVLGTGWLREANSGIFRLWEDLMFLHANCDGPVVLKGFRARGRHCRVKSCFPDV
jgi:hypothetical protein